jgi:hypothetical protein
VTPHGVVVRDLQSRNGISVNGQVVTEARLRPGDVVQVGHLAIAFAPDEAAVRPVSAHTASSETVAVGGAAVPVVDDRTRAASSPALRTASGQVLTRPTSVQPAVLDDRTRVVLPSSGGVPAMRPAAPGVVAAAPSVTRAALDPGDIVIREGMTGPQLQWQLEVAATLDVATLARVAWGRRVLGHGVLLALAVQAVTVATVLVWEANAFGATLLRAWYVLLPAFAAAVLAGLLGSALIARHTAGGIAPPGGGRNSQAR